jgi:crotonobetainyl-CoA:carnitine CoA-transferase CaiB-like acyl-CoA transferase
MGGVLEGVRVLDFGRYIAGPYCATLLAEFGAEVIRVEKRDGSEDRFVAPVGEGGEGALFLQINRNKKCITLDPMKPEGQEVMRRLVTTADVVVANLPPQTLRAMKSGCCGSPRCSAQDRRDRRRRWAAHCERET